MRQIKFRHDWVIMFGNGQDFSQSLGSKGIAAGCHPGHVEREAQCLPA
jgi:hypothetical protein